VKTKLIMIRILALAAVAASAQAVAASTPAALAAETVNDAALVAPVKSGDKGAAVLRAQILLDRARFSPGEVDAAYGSNMRQAITGFQTSRGLPVNGEVDAATWQALDSDNAPALVTVTLSADDVAGPFRPLPSGMAAQAKLDALGYTSSLEALGERFHASPQLLKQLNPGKDFDRAGEQLVVPSVQPTAPMPAVAKLVVDKSASTVSLLDETGKVRCRWATGKSRVSAKIRCSTTTRNCSGMPRRPMPRRPLPPGQTTRSAWCGSTCPRNITVSMARRSHRK
jgi:lipoprotein-anchoring transpeptidase ErfK/SrfK